ncbi:RNA-binding domain-containing protein [Telluribacter sp.]|jgi:ATP-dependent DNA helicase RecG|uniref:RNA-binding domain-containing protein n=1 Tax=Telluribacter sp. TaxID=1978767 RepID=UPI002E1164FA|nr:RNA-binding domain-containing protein [Telluribacter sp.]
MNNNSGLDRTLRLLGQYENIRLEYKESATELPRNLFETICAMLNREGGDILLGVNDHGQVIGVAESSLRAMVDNLVNLSNNPQKLDPPHILHPQTYQVDGRTIVHIQVPASSQVHRSAGVVYDRSNDGDFRVQQPAQIADIHNRKRTHYTENSVYPGLRFSDFKEELFPKIRNLISSHHPSHPWLTLTNELLLERAGLWKRDYQTQNEGYTLAAALLLGKDEVIQSILPHYKIDALVRREDVHRYDDRLYIQTNLIDAYDLLMNFVAKHLPDPFYLEGVQRVSLRSKIFREVVANLIVHREYTSAHPCTFIIRKGVLETENANNPHGYGPIDPQRFVPFPKNPTIVKFFIQLGRVEELGSGVLNINRYLKAYSDAGKPEFIEGPVFKVRIPLPGVEEKKAESEKTGGDEFIETVIAALNDTVNAPNDGVNGGINPIFDGVNDGVKKEVAKLVALIHKSEGINTKQLTTETAKSRRTVERYLKIAREANIIKFKGAPKTGGYFLTEKMKKLLKDDNS